MSSSGPTHRRFEYLLVIIAPVVIGSLPSSSSLCFCGFFVVVFFVVFWLFFFGFLWFLVCFCLFFVFLLFLGFPFEGVDGPSRETLC